MKKFVFLVALLALSTQGYSQNYKIDNGAVVVTKVVENIPGTAQEIYIRAKNYFVRSYGDSNSVLQTDDKENGIIIGKGIYANLAYHTMGMHSFKAYHILRVDIKDGRARIICSADEMISYSLSYGNSFPYQIVDYFPITDRRPPPCMKPAAQSAFEALVVRMNSSVSSLTAALQQGGMLEAEKDNW